jgi:hypothetical protein
VGYTNSPSSVPAPVFLSAPGTTATEGTAYTYQIETSPASGGVTLALASAPSSATLQGYSLSWTPSAAQARTSNQFSLTATNAAGSVTQTWSVTPAGTVNGTWVDSHWTANGSVVAPFDFTKAPLPPAALVPQTDGSLLSIQGSGNSDGTFTIPNVPGGYYWLQPTGPARLYWTSSSTFDFGADYYAPIKSVLNSPASSSVVVNFSGLDPWQAGDEAVFLWPPLPRFLVATASIGATTMTTGALISTNVDLSQPNAAFFLQYEPETFGTLSVLKLGSEQTLPSLALSNGTSNTVSGALAHSPQITFDLNIKGAAWRPLFDNVGPGSPTLEGADLEITAQAFVPGANGLSNAGLGIPLLVDQRQTLPGAPGSLQLFPDPTIPVCESALPITPGSPSFLPGEPAIITDQDFGPVQYGDPFPAAWPRVFTFCQTASVPVPLPGSSTPISFQLVDTQSSALPTSPISPLLGQAQIPTINGKSLFVAATIGGTGVTLGWTAPSGTPPTGYKITEFAADATLHNVQTYVPRAYFYTAKTSAVLPPLQAGQTYVFLITAVLDSAANFETRPNRSALPTAAVSVVSAPITISSGP